MNSPEIKIPQQSIGTSIFYHLAPGILIIIFYLLTGSFFDQLGFRSGFGLLMGFAFVGIPLQIYLMLREGKRINRRYTLKNVLYYRHKIPAWQYFVLALLFVVYALLITSMLGPVNAFLQTEIFSWLPELLTSNSTSPDSSATPIIIVISFTCLFLIDGLINPIIEEMYFRGFLMSRISRFRYLSPLISATLFSLAHFWQPWNTVQIFVMVLPIYYLVLYKKSFLISVVLHCIANLIGASLALSQYVSG